jgi:hypothetical protein
MDSIVPDVDLISKVFHRASDTFSDALDHEAIDIVNVRQPGLCFLVWLDLLLGNFEKPLDLLAVDLDILKLWSDQ